MSERAACRATGQHRSAQRRPPAGRRGADPDSGLREWLRQWAKTHPRQGFRRAYHDARAEGWAVNHKKIQRLWRAEGLRAPVRRRRKRLGGPVERSITADRLIDELDRIAAERGHPAVLRCDSGPELVCSVMADRAGERVGLAFIPPGRPWRNGYIESFDGRLRDECLNINSFWSPTQARVVITEWKTDYNQRRRHSALGYRTPAGYAAICTHQ